MKMPELTTVLFVGGELKILGGKVQMPYFCFILKRWLRRLSANRPFQFHSCIL